MSLKRMRFFRIAAFAWALWFAGTKSSAQDGPTLTLAEAVAVALDQNFDLRLAEKSVESARVSHTAGNAGLLPEASFTGSVEERIDDSELELVFGGEQGETRETISQSGVNTNTINAGVGVSYTLPSLVSNFLRFETLAVRDRQAQRQLAFEMENVAAQVGAAYVNAARLKRRLEIDEAFIGLSQERLKRAESRQAFGGSNRLQVLQAEVDLKNDSVSYRNTELAYRNAKRDLNFLLGRGPEEGFEVETDLPYQETFDYAALSQSLQDRNPAILVAQQDVLLAEKQSEIEEKSWLPTLSASAQYGYFRQTTEVGVLQRNRTLGFTGGVSVSMPIYSGGQKRVARQTAQIAVEQSRMGLEQTRLDLERQLANAFATYRNALSQLDIERANLATFELNFRKSQDDYRNGQISSTDLRAAQVNLQQAQNRIANLEYDLKLSEIDLLRLSGGLVEAQTDTDDR